MASVIVETRFSPTRRDRARDLVALKDWNETIHSSGYLYGAIRLEIDGAAILAEDVFGALDLLWLSVLEMTEAIVSGEAFDDFLYDCTRLRLVARPAGHGHHRDRLVRISLVAPDDLPEYNRSASTPASELVRSILAAATDYYQWLAANKPKDRPDAIRSMHRIDELRSAFDSARNATHAAQSPPAPPGD